MHPAGTRAAARARILQRFTRPLPGKERKENQHTTRNMNLNHITSVEQANEQIKKFAGGWLSLDGLTSAEGLVPPKEVRWLYLNGLTSAKGLVLPKKVGSLSLNGLTSKDREALREQYPSLDIWP